MSRYAIDIETNGLLDELDRVHCMVIVDLDTGEVGSYRQEEVRAGLCVLANASLIVAHNAIGFDIPALQKVYPEWCTSATIRDTLLLSRLQYPEVKHTDQRMFEKEKFPQKLIGRFSLKAWGHRLSCHKGEYEGGWDKWTPEMQQYCEQDVAVLVQLWNMLQKDPYAEAAVDLEHCFAELAFRIEREGFPFNEEAAVKLYADLSSRQTAIESELQDIFPPRVVGMKSHWWVREEVYECLFPVHLEDVAYESKKAGIEDGVPADELIRGPLKTKSIPFNPGSRDQIAARLIEKYNWKPSKFTPAGKPAVDEEVVGEMVYPEAKLIGEYLSVTKLRGTLAEGGKSWLKSATKGRLHQRIISAGAVTRRCTHKYIVNIPSNKKTYGKRCRELFTAPPGYKVVGADASGIELRCLAHYLSKWDGRGVRQGCIGRGRATRCIKKLRGLPTRDHAKTFGYAYLYGAQNAKLGSIVGKGAKAGKEMRAKLEGNIPALGHLQAALSRRVENRGHLLALDGGRLNIPLCTRGAQHAATVGRSHHLQEGSGDSV